MIHSTAQLATTKGLLSTRKPLKGIHQESVSYDEIVKVYRDLVASADALMVNTASQQSGESESGESGESSEQEQEDLQQLQDTHHLRRLVLEQALITLPVLKGIHHVEGIPFEEDQLGDKVDTRDELSVDILHALHRLKGKNLRLRELKSRNKELTEQIRAIVGSNNDNNNNDTNNDNDKKEPKELTLAKEKSYLLTEDIHALIVTNGLNWAEDEELMEMVMYCSDIYR